MSTQVLAGSRVLLLDESALMRGSLARLLRYLYRFKLVVLPDIDSALAAIATERRAGRCFDAVVTELDLSGSCGLRALERISSVDPRLAFRAVVFTRAHLDEAERNAIRVRGHELVSKSAPLELPAAIARQIARSPRSRLRSEAE